MTPDPTPHHASHAVPTSGRGHGPGAQDPADVCVLVVAFNSGEHLPGLLESLPDAAADLSLRVIVVDNESTDDTVAVARQFGVTVVESGGNIGYAAGINRGRPHAEGCRAILVANPDLRLGPRAIKVLFDEAESTGGVVVPLLRGADGRHRPSIRREPTVSRQLGEALLGDHWPTRPASLAIMVRDPRAYEVRSEVDWATGAALMFTAACDADVGPWAEEYFLYSEEIDFARRVRGTGRTITFLPDVWAEHSEGGSGRSERLFALDTVNRIRYFRAWHGRWHTMAYSAAILIELLLRFRRPAYRGALRVAAESAARISVGVPLPDGRDVVGVAPSAEPEHVGRHVDAEVPRASR